MLDLAKARLPKVGSYVEATTDYGPRRGELVGVVPGKESGTRRDRAAKLALRGDGYSCAIPGHELVKVRRIKRPKGARHAGR